MKPPFWNKYEAAILLDGLISVIEGNVTRAEAIKKISKDLRNLALSQGLKINSVYRNENGISFQLQSMESAYYGYTIFKPATKLFTEVVTLYHKSRTEYQKLLKEAFMLINKNNTLEDCFMQYLATMVSPAKLSVLYPCYAEIESFCLKIKVLKVPLFQTTDFETIKKVQRTIEQNKIFRATHKKQYSKIVSAGRYYYNYVKEGCFSNSLATVSKIELNASKKNEDIQDNYWNMKQQFAQWLEENVGGQQRDNQLKCLECINAYCECNSIISEGIFAIQSSEKIKTLYSLLSTDSHFMQIFISNKENSLLALRYYQCFLESIENFQQQSPVFEKVDNIKTVLCKENCYIKKPEEDLLETVKPTIESKEDISDTKSEVMKWSFVSQESPNDFERICPVGIIYFEQNYSCNGWVDAYIKTIHCFQDDYPAIIRGLVGYKFADISKIAWCGQGNVSLLQRPIEIRDHIFVESSLLPDEIINILKIVAHRCNVESENLSLKYVYVSAKIDDTLNSTENGNITVKSTIDDQKRLFSLWLIEKNGMTETLARSYSSAIHTAGQYVIQHGIANMEFFALKDDKTVENMAQQLFDNPEFVAINISQHNRFQIAITKYLSFCRNGQQCQGCDMPYDCSVPVGESIRQNFKQWMETQHMQKAVIASYLSDIKKCSEFARENGYISFDFFEIEDWQTIDNALLEMKKNPKFIEINEQRYNRPTSAMHKLIMYRRLNQRKSDNKTELLLKSEQLSNTKSINEQIKLRYLSILKENFEDGFRYGKAIDKNRFRIYYSDKYGCDLADNDEQLVTALMNIGNVREERIFAKADDQQNSILKEIVTKIVSTFDAGASCIYLDCLFNYFQETLVEDLHIYSSEALETVILAQEHREYFKRYNFLCCCRKEPNPQSDVIQYMRNSLTPVLYSTIEKDLWFIPLDKIKQVLVNAPQIVNVATETYFYAPNFPVSEDELQRIADLINEILLQQSYISDVTLTEQIEKNIPSVIVNTSEYSMWGRRNVLAYLLRDKFSFRGAIISTKGEELSMLKCLRISANTPVIYLLMNSKHLLMSYIQSYIGILFIVR